MSEKRKTINEILFDSTYYRNHCTDEYKDSILKDLLLADSGISYKEFIKKNIEELKKYSDVDLIVKPENLADLLKFSDLLTSSIQIFIKYLSDTYMRLVLSNKKRFENNPKDENIKIIDNYIVYIKLFYTYLKDSKYGYFFYESENYNIFCEKRNLAFTEFFNYLAEQGTFVEIFLSDTDIFIDNINLNIMCMIKKEIKNFNNLFNNLPSTISFEGVDATGKGTFSKGLEYIVNAVNAAATEGNCGYAQRINVPDYNTYYGKNIKNRLETSKDITSDIELDNTIYTFALNRREILNSIQSSGSAGKIKRNNIIFDRQTTSSCAFTCGKYLTQKNKDIGLSGLSGLSNDFSTDLKSIIFNLIPEQKESSNILTLFNLFKYLQKIYYTEFTVLKNIKPDFEVFCFSDINTIQKRIENRRKTTNSEVNNDNDVHKKDVHEDNKNILQNTNSIYTFIYNITKAYKKLSKKCQRMYYSKKDTNNILWYETTKVLEEYIEEFGTMDKRETLDEYINQIDSFRDLFEHWFNYQETIAINNEYEDYNEEEHMLSYTEKCIFDIIKYMNQTHNTDNSHNSHNSN